MNINWEAQRYTADFSFVHQYGNSVIGLIDSPAGSRVLDLGCGEFVFEMGGYGNNRLIHSALADTFAEHGYPYTMPFCFPTIGKYASLLETAGFKVTYAVLFDRPTKLDGEDGLKDWITMFVKTPFSVVRDEYEMNEILDQTVERLREDLFIDGSWYSDYVRLRMKAVRAE